MTNIDLSAFHRGEYVGYGGGLVWRIKKGFKCWIAAAPGRSAYQPTLRLLNDQLHKLPSLST